MPDSGTGPFHGCHVYVDESKDRTYLLVAATIAPADAGNARTKVRSMRHTGSASLHMRQERDSHRKQVASALSDMRKELRVHVFECPDRSIPEIERRLRCLAAVLDLCEELQASRLVLELDQSVQATDKKFLFEQCRQRQLPRDFVYEWRARNEEPLLWSADVVAWCHNRGGAWPGRIESLVEEKRRV